MLDKLGGASELKMKNFALHFVFHSACTNFAFKIKTKINHLL